MGDGGHAHRALLGECISVHAWVYHDDIDPGNHVYTLDVDSIPRQSDHVCITSGIEEQVKRFREDLESSARSEPTQPFPALYQTVRRRFTSKLSYDLKVLFLAQIPSYDSVQTTLYRIRRELG